MELANHIRAIADFPKPGIIFRDVSTLFDNPCAFEFCVEQIAARFSDTEFDKIVALEARGFILGAALAQRLKTGMVLIRKTGKLPLETVRESYELEYGTSEFEIHKDALLPGQKVLVVDDLIATGGTAEAGIKLVERLGAQAVGCGFIIELSELGGREKLEKMGIRVESLIAFDGA